MKRAVTLAAYGAFLALALLAGPAAEAGDRDGRRHEQRYDRHGWHDQKRHHHDRHHDRHRYHAGPYHRPHGYRPHHWRRGDRLPRAYYAPRYVIHHHHHYGLRRPPHGHHWVRVDRDVVLAAIATGVILEVIHDHFH